MTVNVFTSLPQNAMSLRSPTDSNSQSPDNDAIKEHHCGASEASQSQSVNAAGQQQSDHQGGGSGQQAFNNSGFKALAGISAAANDAAFSAVSQVTVLSNKAVASVQSFSFALTSSASGVQMSFSAKYARIDVGGFLSVMQSSTTSSTISGIDQLFGEVVSALAGNNASSVSNSNQSVFDSLQGIIKLLGQLLSLAINQQAGNLLAQGFISAHNTSASNNGVNQGLPQCCDQIVELLQNLAKVLNQENSGSQAGNNVDNSDTSASSTTKYCSDNPDVIEVNHGRVWGDPHFVGADNGKYDVHGEAGKTYNILSDEGVQLNATFAGRGKGITVMSDAGLTLDGDQIHFDKDGKLSINGEQVADGDDSGTYLDGKITKEKGKLSIKAGEYDIDMTAVGQRLDFDFSSPNANADGVLPHGLWGQSVDGDGQARTGDKGKEAQGGGAIEGENGLTEKGDKTAVELYETDGLFDTNFENFNRYHANGNNDAVNTGESVTSNRATDVMTSIKMASDVSFVNDSELQATTTSLKLALEASFSTQAGDNH